ncbi:MAG: hypothetical protein ABJN69_05695 [Hellea sp.]
MRLLLSALLLSISVSTPIGAWADNIAGCEVVLMEKIAQEGLEGSAEVASFRPAEDFIASIYDDETEVLREIDGLPIRAIMCKRQSVIPSLRDFPIVATGTPFMISQNFDSTDSGLTTVYFQDGKFRSSYKGPELDAKIDAKMADRMEVFNLQPHDLAEKEKAMLDRKTAQTDENLADENLADENLADADTPDENKMGENKVDEDNPDKDKVKAQVASEDELLGVSMEPPKADKTASEDELLGVSKASSTEESNIKDDSETESKDGKEAAPKQKAITKEQHDTYK